MLRKLTALGVFILALAPSAYLAWSLRAMPHLGFYHDDSIYWVSAKSLAEGHEYRIASLPGQPYQTKYPPLYPALLAAIWKIAPDFPSNLPLATLFAWLLLPIYLAMVWLFLREYGFRWREQCVLVMIAGLSPVAATFSFSLMPELLFTALLVASVLLAERSLSDNAAWWLPLIAGTCGALAYLTKSAAGPLLFTAPFYFLWRRQFAKAALFFAAMFPAMAGWQWWAARHVSHSWDLVTLYYTNYLGFQLYNVSLRDLPLVFWHNLDGFLLGIGKLLTFDIPWSAKPLERVVAVAAIAGIVRLARRTQKLQYPLAAAGISALLLVWHYVPDQRFVFPLYPLLLAGLWTELSNVWQALRVALKKPAAGERVVAFAGAGALAALALFVAFTTCFGLFNFLPDLLGSYRDAFESRRPAYEWLAKNSAPDANVFAYDDPLLYLYSGRKSCNLPIPPKFFYHNDDAGIDKLLHSIPDFARQYRISYVLLTPNDFYRDLHEPGARHLADAVEHSTAFRPAFKTPSLEIFRYAPNVSLTAVVR
ncbi:MAG TPA: hypothetical protein VKT81_11935 [Bryobacteraceae bacterium]|nr:hypothetical protein [Bryobacteraceae bacterium]